MTDELCKALVDRLRDEINDVHTYCQLAEHATGYAAVVLDGIIKDEESHARYLKDVLHKDHCVVPEDICKAYEDMEHTFHNRK